MLINMYVIDLELLDRNQIHFFSFNIFPWDDCEIKFIVHILQPVSSSAAFLLGEIADTQQEAAQPLVRLFVHYEKILPFIRSLADWEMSHMTWVLSFCAVVRVSNFFKKKQWGHYRLYGVFFTKKRKKRKWLLYLHQTSYTILYTKVKADSEW